MTTRDPRPGDVVQPEGSVAVQVHYRGDYVHFEPLPLANRIWSDLTLKGWQAMVRNATVIHAAPEADQ
jgi:hypothetical protein